MVLSKCAKCGSKKSRFIKDQEAKGLLSNLGIRIPLNKVPILGDILFQYVAKRCIKRCIQKFKETGDTNYIYKNELNKACFQHDMAYGEFKGLKRITFSDKVLRDKPFNIAKKSKV